MVHLVTYAMSLSSSIAATLYSSVYESERRLRASRELRNELEKLDKCLRVLSDHKQSDRAPSKALWPAERECRSLLQETSSAVARLPSGIRDMTGNHESIAFARCLEPIEAHCRQQTKYTPIFWRLQSWITVSCVLHVGAILIRCSEIRHGSPAIVSAQIVHDTFNTTSDPTRPVAKLDYTSRCNSDFLQITIGPPT